MKNYLGEFKNKDWVNVQREQGDYWKVKEGSKTFWYIQAPKGVIPFTTKKRCLEWVATTK